MTPKRHFFTAIVIIDHGVQAYFLPSMKPSFRRRRPTKHAGIIAVVIFVACSLVIHQSLSDVEENSAFQLPSISSSVKQTEATIPAVETYNSDELLSCLPQFPLSSDSSWKRDPATKNSWIFSNSKIETPLKINETQQRSFTFNHSLVLYGSSHLRELYFSLIRLDRGVSYKTILEDKVKLVGSGSPEWPTYNATICDPHQTGHVQGHYGVDLVHCGPPGKRLVPELSPQVVIGFKTFLHTPQAEDSFVDFLQASHLSSSPSIVLVDVGIWGPRKSKTSEQLQTTMTPLQELDYYLDWTQRTFPKSIIVYIYEDLLQGFERPNYNSSLVLERIQGVVSSNKNRAVLLRKDYIMKRIPKDIFPCGHGCAGPVIQVMAHLLLDWLDQVSTLCIK